MHIEFMPEVYLEQLGEDAPSCTSIRRRLDHLEGDVSPTFSSSQVCPGCAETNVSTARKCNMASAVDGQYVSRQGP